MMDAQQLRRALALLGVDLNENRAQQVYDDMEAILQEEGRSFASLTVTERAEAIDEFVAGWREGELEAATETA